MEKLAIVVTKYCVSISDGKKIGIHGHAVAAPLFQQLYKHIILRGGHPVPQVKLDGFDEFLLRYGNQKQITHVSPFSEFFISKVDALINILAETNTRRLSTISPKKLKQRAASQRKIKEIYAERLLKPGTCTIIPYPTQALAQEAEMSLSEYQDFVATACFLEAKDPVEKWKQLSKMQGTVIQQLSKSRSMHFLGEDTDLKLNVEGRNWVNCDGHVNMPDGEIFTCPIENSAQGKIRFTYPGIFMGREVDDITLTFQDGKAVKAEAEKGEDFLKEILKTDKGAKIIGEIAIGTNTGITKFTKNMLFDEKMGHCIHLALGLSPFTAKTGGKNRSSIHWDLLKDMQNGEIYADDELVYKNGKFTL